MKKCYLCEEHDKFDLLPAAVYEVEVLVPQVCAFDGRIISEAHYERKVVHGHLPKHAVSAIPEFVVFCHKEDK